MRVRCTFCGAEYEAPVTRAALVLVGRCEYCRRQRLEPVDDGGPDGRPDGGPPGGPAAPERPDPQTVRDARPTPLAPRGPRPG
jgi:hypothetical protein